jgi:hypothetical protein
MPTRPATISVGREAPAVEVLLEAELAGVGVPTVKTAVLVTVPLLAPLPLPTPVPVALLPVPDTLVLDPLLPAVVKVVEALPHLAVPLVASAATAEETMVAYGSLEQEDSQAAMSELSDLYHCCTLELYTEYSDERDEVMVGTSQTAVFG